MNNQADGEVLSGGVNTGGGDFVGRDQIVYGNLIKQIIMPPAEVREIEHLPPENGPSPYMSLSYYDEKDYALFFGREMLVTKVIQRLKTTSFLAIVGASGSGKSSLLRAGVIYTLHSGSQMPDGSPGPLGSRNWLYRVFKPGPAPMQVLAEALTQNDPNLEAALNLRGQLAQNPQNLTLAARRLLSSQSCDRLVLAVDQFEEVFTLCANPAERTAFLDSLVYAAAQAGDSKITILLTLRADFYAHCGNHEGLRSIMAHDQEYIGAMSREEMLQAIIQPIVKSGQWKIQEGLAEQMLEDVGSEPGALALLSHALYETWKRRRGVTLTLSGYKEAGGVRGAVAQAAEGVYKGQLTEDQQTAARNIFLRLTELGDGTPDTRRRASRSEILTSSAAPEQTAVVLTILDAARLIITDRDAASGEETVEVSHEALIRYWARLRTWLEEDRQLLRLRSALQQATAEWLGNEKNESYLVHRDDRLKDVMVLLNHPRVTLDKAERVYLVACQKQARIDKASIARSGWGIIFAQDADPAIYQALKELREHRQRQIGAKNKNYYHEFTREKGFRPNDSMRKFLARSGVGSTRPTPDRMPYYLLIVGDPETIPFSFQFQLDMQYAVGRIAFDTVEEYAQYARSVVAAETGQCDLPGRAVIFAPSNPDDVATRMSLEKLATPLADVIAEEAPEWTVERCFQEDATKIHLAELLNNKNSPALLFTCGHGLSYKCGHERQLQEQGALVCQDWPGGRTYRGPLTRDHYFSAEDVAPDANLLGSVIFLWSCYGAGTPRMNNYAEASFLENADQIAPYSFISELPKKLLSRPSGGALAVIGSIERKWNLSFSGELGENDRDIFKSVMVTMMEGMPVGAAVENFSLRYSLLLSELIEQLQMSKDGKTSPIELSTYWTATTDARNYIILGDPAVRIQVGEKGSGKRNAIQPVSDLNLPPLAPRIPPAEPAASGEVSEVVAKHPDVPEGATF
jgi:energy-coupling factor transporter ATP-binding protein EcfA2